MKYPKEVIIEAAVQYALNLFTPEYIKKYTDSCYYDWHDDFETHICPDADDEDIETFMTEVQKLFNEKKQQEFGAIEDHNNLVDTISHLKAVQNSLIHIKENDHHPSINDRLDYVIKLLQISGEMLVDCNLITGDNVKNNENDEDYED